MSSFKYDRILRHNVGEFGRYQKTQLLFVCIPALFVSCHLSVTTLLIDIPSFRSAVATLFCTVQQYENKKI